MIKRAILLLTIGIIVILAITINAQTTNTQYTWDQKSTGTCPQTNQCLVSNSYNEQNNDQPDKYWSGLSNSEKPKCIANGQYISDNYCDNGKWSSRTKKAATQLLTIAQNNPKITLYCDKYDKTLNDYNYNTNYGLASAYLTGTCLQIGNKKIDNCINNICVIQYGQNIAFSITLNTDISGAKSPLQALNAPTNKCDNAKNNDADYDPCGNGIWYNHDTQTIIYAPDTTTMPTPTTDPTIATYDKIKTYVSSYIGVDYTQYNTQPQLQQLYYSKNGPSTIFSFKETNKTIQQKDYSGWYFSNVPLPTTTCDKLKKYDDRTNCEIQPNTAEFFAIAQKTPQTSTDLRKSIVDVWQQVPR